MKIFIPSSSTQMTEYKAALCYQNHEESCVIQPLHVVQPKRFGTSDEFYTWLHQQMEEHQKRVAAVDSTYSKKQIEFLDRVESDIIDFLYEMKEEYGIQCNLADFLDNIILPSVSSARTDDVEDEEDSGLFDE